ncbi:hypothetical protein EII34_15125 [Arachnia propionica]|uniref:Uncharacterized protein n=1 Tax=Arachnia propionica TaxID=1750 RepID=A0A3P1T1T6_9ACTN|nr:hypothetical protein [Arachnia propionica]RRD03235.1 hypothetical protein EII34_15125 [Arachnia propionica]
MDLTSAGQLLAGAVAASNAQGQRYEWGRWDGSRLWLDTAPDIGLTADNAAGPLSPGQRVLAIYLARTKRWIIIGPAATTLEARLSQLEAQAARLPRVVARGQWVEPDPGPTTSFIRWPAGVAFTSPPTIITQLASSAGVFAGARSHVDGIGLTGFRLSTTGTSTGGCPWMWTAIQ